MFVFFWKIWCTLFSWRKTKEPLELELTSWNKKNTPKEKKVKGLMKITPKNKKMLIIKLNVLGLQV